MTQLATIYEDPREEWADNEVHRHYNMPMVAVRAKPRIQMRCNVYRDNASLLKVNLSIDKWVNTEYFIWEMSAGLANSGVSPQWKELFEEKYKEKWVQIQNEFEGIADLPERFLHKVPAPPFQVAEVRIKTKKDPCYWRLRANTGRHMVDTSFWYLWKLILQQNSPVVGTFDVILRAPSHTPAGEVPIAPWDVPLSDGSHWCYQEDVSYPGCERARKNLAPLDFTCLRQGVQRDDIPLARRGRSRSTSATVDLSQRRRARTFYD
ncbi:uncharacterized protein PGRI_042040 [Penicillium griseofulvum]|uniref:Uncharacterized protein n=1 Tax=Penicillium patulum TaxID=5078 RepID=A0A135L8K3_PENPA|nr:uncharacterized protein PGRI_042040 [Penicillium griseofulvum]KXG45291.1 hypothetical protein PGRI_042040 [Penicillium griseofulvum]